MDAEAYEDKERDLFFRIKKSVRYHNYRKRFFINFHNWATFASVISGTVVFATILGKANHVVQLFWAACVTMFSTLDLIVSSSTRVREYEDLSRRHIALEQELLLKKDKDMGFLLEIEAKLLQIEADEPPILRTLNVICFNETIKAMGLDPEAEIKVGRLQRFLRHFWDLSPDKL